MVMDEMRFEPWTNQHGCQATVCFATPYQQAAPTTNFPPTNIMRRFWELAISPSDLPNSSKGARSIAVRH